MRSRRRSLLAAVLATIALTGTACSGDGATPATSGSPSPSKVPASALTLPPEPPGIRLSFIQQRFEEGTRNAGLTVINITEHPLRVRSVLLDWPGYPTPPQPLRYVVQPGARVDLHYRLPEADCSPAVADATPVGVVATARGPVRRDIDAEGLRFLGRIWKAACNERRMARTVEISYAGPWRESTRDGEPVLSGSIRLTRSGTRTPVTLTGVQGSPLFDLAVEPRTLDAGAVRTDVPLAVTSGGRCDPHSRSSVTTPFTFRVFATLGDDPSQVAVVAVPDHRAQVRMLAFLDEVCARS